MPTFMLEGSTPARLTARPITIRLQLGGPVAGRLVALADGAPFADAVRPRPDLLVLPNVHGTVQIRIEPDGAAVFAHGSIANVSVSVNDPGAADPERAVLPPVDLAGLAGRLALSITRDGESLRVSSEVRPVAQVTLGPLGDAARVAATEIIGAQRLDDRDALDIAVAVDTSASFRRLAASGHLRRALDLVSGVAAVVDADRVARAVVLATPERRVSPADDETLATAVERALGDLVPESGAALASGEHSALRRLVERGGRDRPGGAGSNRSITYVLTDAVPADRAAFESLHDADRSMHLVVVGRESAWRLQRRPDTPSTLLDIDRLGPAPADGATDPDPLAAHPDAVRELVASLLAGRPE